MLALFSFASLVAFCGVGAAVGWRILRLARASGGAAERWIGLCLLTICGLGYPALIAGQSLPANALRVALVSLGIASVNVGLACIFWFTRLVFRPGVRWLPFALAVPMAALALHWLGMTANLASARGSLDEMARTGVRWTLLSCLVSGAGFGWTAVEALAYWAILRRREKLGLADPLVAHRMLLWGLVGVSTILINAANAAAVLRGVNVLQDPVAMLATGVLGLWNAVALWLAFLPPEAYVRRVRRRAPGSDPTAAS